MQILDGTQTQGRVTFGLFEADLKSGELRKAGNRVKLQGLPFKVLTILLENAGEVVTREELQIRIWGPDVIVDFEHSLSNAIKKLRESLGDSADNPRFIETLSRRGFRFIAPVAVAYPLSHEIDDTTLGAEFPQAESRTMPDAAISAVELTPSGRSWRRYQLPALAFGFGGLLVGSALQIWNGHRSPTPLPRISPITYDGIIYAPKDNLLGSLSAFVTDGVHLFTPTNQNGQDILSQISFSTGNSQPMPLLSEIRAPGIEDISPDGARLLVRSNLASAIQQPLWVVTIDGVSAFRVSNVLAQDAIWMSDGKDILYTSGNQIAVVSPDDGRSTLLATVPGRAFWPRWSPDGKVLRFTIIDPVNHISSLWEIGKGQKVTHPILEALNKSTRECCGIWTADGKFFIFEATSEGYTDLWKVDASLKTAPIRITNGPFNSRAPSPGRKGEQIFFVGQDVHSLLERYDSERKEYVPQQGFLATADRVRYSLDGRWVIWVEPDHRLWRARSDGTDKVLLTPASMRVFVASWSPDNTRVAFMAREPEQPWQIYMVNADGGVPQRLLRENRNIGDPTFSADGKFVVFGTVAELMGEAKAPRSIFTMELATQRVTELAHSEGLFSPTWSPDGRFIAAITLDQKNLMVYDTETTLWKNIAVISASWPVWSRDSKALYVHGYQAENKPILRVSVPDGKIEEIANLNNYRAGAITHADFAGVTPDNVPLMHAEISSGNLYALDLQQK